MGTSETRYGTVVRWYGGTLRFWLLPRRQPWSKPPEGGKNIKLWICDLWPTFITINITTIITIIIHHHIFLCNIISSLLLSFGPHRPHCCLLCLDCQKRWILRGVDQVSNTPTEHNMSSSSRQKKVTMAEWTFFYAGTENFVVILAKKNNVSVPTSCILQVFIKIDFAN